MDTKPTTNSPSPLRVVLLMVAAAWVISRIFGGSSASDDSSEAAERAMKAVQDSQGAIERANGWAAAAQGWYR
jgi:hypothetical protein